MSCTGASGSRRRPARAEDRLAPKTGYKWLLRYAQAGASWRVCSRAKGGPVLAPSTGILRRAGLLDSAAAPGQHPFQRF